METVRQIVLTVSGRRPNMEHLMVFHAWRGGSEFEILADTAGKAFDEADALGVTILRDPVGETFVRLDGQWAGVA